MNLELSILAAALVGALAWDLVLGELPNALHPVAWVGRLMAAWKKRAPRRGWPALLAGAVFALGLPTLLAIATHFLLTSLAPVPLAGGLVALFLLQASFAWSALFRAGANVRAPLVAGDVPGARVQLGALCSRDPEGLSAAQLEVATVESLAENTSDSFVAPLFWIGLCGVPGAVFYRVANTADAMLGYRGDMEFAGKAAARLDDLLNLVPARLTGVSVVFASAMLRLDTQRSVAVLSRDRRVTDSPNAGWPMAAAAGALDTVLAKPGSYALGEGLVHSRELAPGALITSATRLCRVASLVGAALAFGLGFGLQVWLTAGEGLHAAS